MIWPNKLSQVFMLVNNLDDNFCVAKFIASCFVDQLTFVENFLQEDVSGSTLQRLIEITRNLPGCGSYGK